jgi:hypothetical protein
VVLTVVTLAATGAMLSYAHLGAKVAVSGLALVAAVVAAVLEVRYRWRGVIAGVAFTVGIAALLGLVGFWVLCGTFLN